MIRQTAVAVALLVVSTGGPAGAQMGVYADADSADALDEALEGMDPSDAVDVAEVLSDPFERGRGRFASAELVSGYRRALRVRAEHAGVAFSARRTDDGDAHWLDVRTGSWLERVTAGGLRPAAGGGLVLGARSSRFASSRRVAPGGLVVGPSLSLSHPIRGVAVAVRASSLRLCAAGWRCDTGARGRWGAAAWVGGGGSVAVAAGRADGAPSVWSLTGTRAFSGAGLEGELACIGAAVLIAVTARAGDWELEMYRGPPSASGGMAVVEGGSLSDERGASLRWSRRVVAAAFYTARRRSPERTRLRRRLDARWEAAGKAARLRLDARLDTGWECRTASGLLSGVPARAPARSGRLRARLDVDAGPGLRLRYHVQARMEPGVRPGVISGAEVCRRDARVELRLAVTGFSLWSGTGYVARSGIAGYDRVGTVTRRGSDLTASATLDLGRGADVTVHAGVPWDRSARYLVTVRWRARGRA